MHLCMACCICSFAFIWKQCCITITVQCRMKWKEKYMYVNFKIWSSLMFQENYSITFTETAKVCFQVDVFYVCSTTFKEGFQCYLISQNNVCWFVFLLYIELLQISSSFDQGMVDAMLQYKTNNKYKEAVDNAQNTVSLKYFCACQSYDVVFALCHEFLKLQFILFS